MITQEIANYLIELPKHIIEGDIPLDEKEYTPSIPIDDRLLMVSKADTEVSFFLEINQSAKKLLKLTLHFQEKDATIGLLRVDFNGRHHNPEGINAFVPEIFKTFAGQWIEENHIHYFIEGYKPLAWAIPLNSDSSFAIKDFADANDIAGIIQEFGRRIHLQTIISTTIQSVLI